MFTTEASHFRDAWLLRLATLAAALGKQPPDLVGEGGFVAALAALIDIRDRTQVWLALAVLTGRLPEEHLVLEVARTAEFAPDELFSAVRKETTVESARWTVEVESARILVDVSDTVATTITTGIQRVVREVSKRWARHENVRFVSWVEGRHAMRDLQPVELARVRSGLPRVGEDPEVDGNVVVVPWGTTYFLPEVGAEPPRAERLRALGRFGRTRGTAIGYDLIPVTSSETIISAGHTAVFAQYMAALKYFVRVCTISEATAIEFNGWRAMLRAAGIIGPEVRAVLLPASVGESDEGELSAAWEEMHVGAMPLVLVVGSHEPRKNHMAVLQASEVLWREGYRFSLCFIGGNAWRSEEFRDRLGALQAAGWPVEAISRASDARLWAAYRLARFTVFPSLNEGFGLPVAESLAAGTPVITSEFGSTREIAESGGGALLIDPRDDDDIIAAMRTLLADEVVLARLSAEAIARPPRTWDDYADEVWEVLVEDLSREGDETEPSLRA